VLKSDAGNVVERSPRHRLVNLISALAAHEQVRYLIVAGAVSLAYLAVVALFLAVGLPYMLAIVVTQVITICGAFPVYRKLIFRSKNPWLQDFPRFIGVWTGGIIGGFIATPLLVEVAGMKPFYAQVVSMVVIAVFGYLGHHFVSFKKPKGGT